MRKIAFSAILLLCVSLCACGKKPVFETVDDQIVPALAEEPSYVIFVSLPNESFFLFSPFGIVLGT